MFLIADLKRALFSRRFLISCVAYGLLLCLNSPEEKYNSASLNFYVMYNAGFFNMFFICAAIPFSGCFAADAKNGLLPYAIIRVGLKKYSVAKIVVTYISAFAVTSIGSSILVLFLCCRSPLEIEFFVDFWGYDALLGNQQYLQYFFTRITLTSSIGAAFAVIGLYLSSFNEQELTAAISPIVIYYVYNEFANWGIIPRQLNISYLLFAPIDDNKSISMNVLYAIFFSLFITFSFGILFFLKIQRRRR